MKIATATICTKCDEVYDSALYRVCPACSCTDAMRLVDKISPPIVDNPVPPTDAEKCK